MVKRRIMFSPRFSRPRSHVLQPSFQYSTSDFNLATADQIFTADAWNTFFATRSSGNNFQIVAILIDHAVNAALPALRRFDRRIARVFRRHSWYAIRPVNASDLHHACASTSPFFTRRAVISAILEFLGGMRILPGHDRQRKRRADNGPLQISVEG